MKNVRVKAGLNCAGNYHHVGIFEGKTRLMYGDKEWSTKKAAIHNAKAMAKRIGIKYDPEIVKQHDC